MDEPFDTEAAKYRSQQRYKLGLLGALMGMYARMSPFPPAGAVPTTPDVPGES